AGGLRHRGERRGDGGSQPRALSFGLSDPDGGGRDQVGVGAGDGHFQRDGGAGGAGGIHHGRHGAQAGRGRGEAAERGTGDARDGADGATFGGEPRAGVVFVFGVARPEGAVARDRRVREDPGGGFRRF